MGKFYCFVSFLKGICRLQFCIASTFVNGSDLSIGAQVRGTAVYS